MYIVKLEIKLFELNQDFNNYLIAFNNSIIQFIKNILNKIPIKIYF